MARVSVGQASRVWPHDGYFILDAWNKELTWSTVRIGGKIVCVGTLDLDNTVHMKVGVRKRLSIIFSYGGQARDLEAVLHLMSKNVLRPQVETGRLQDFPQVLRDLCNGKVKGRMALLQG